eukprot:gene39915-48602_t
MHNNEVENENFGTDNGNGDVSIDDVEIDEDFLDPDALLAKQQAELARQAEERRKRLEAIKMKYDQAQGAAPQHVSPPRRKEDHEAVIEEPRQKAPATDEDKADAAASAGKMSKETSYEDMQQLDEEEGG